MKTWDDFMNSITFLTEDEKKEIELRAKEDSQKAKESITDEVIE